MPLIVRDSVIEVYNLDGRQVHSLPVRDNVVGAYDVTQPDGTIVTSVRYADGITEVYEGSRLARSLA